MWCDRKKGDRKSRIEDIITYFEGTCEFCIGNIGVNGFVEEIRGIMLADDEKTEEEWMLLYYAYGLIEYKCNHLDKARKNWNMALVSAHNQKDEIYCAKIGAYLAICEYVNGNLDKAQALFEKALDTFLKKQRYTEAALMYINILWYKRYESNKKKVLEYMDKALEYVQKNENAVNARIYLHIGYIYKTIFNDFGEGIEHLIKTVKLCRQNNNIEMLCMAYHVIADGYMQVGEFDKTEKIYNALLVGEEYQCITPILKGMIRTNLCMCYLVREKNDEAYKCAVELQKLIDVMPESIVEQFRSIMLWIKATSQIRMKWDLDIAKDYLDECMNHSGSCDNSIAIGMFDYKLWGTFGAYYEARGMWLDAVSAYNTQYKCATKYGLWEQKVVLQKLGELFEQDGQQKKAEEYFKKSKAIQDVIFNEQKIANYDKIYEAVFAQLDL